MPPYKKPTSESQRRYMFILEREGRLRKGEARGKSRSVKGKKLPRHAKKRPRRQRRYRR